jgi:hypothetical protein
MLTRRCESAEEDSESHIERGLYGSFNDLVRGKNFLNEMIFYFTFTYENTFLKAFLTVFCVVHTQEKSISMWCQPAWC